ncbi:hypothetical protein GQ55_6G280200 [Panicum hallii var. hallii]|uniref:Uncharacterized protein n=1 Tax=Panicum hallii var. hallii TaxID=1504633 RepID=A0A2T7DAE6_9POAL|nr:hypothetical protein GQ55_6G280200 [Panicum hallii var. hallii]
MPELQELVAPDSQEPEEVVMPELQELTPDLEMEVVPDLQMAPDSITPELPELAPDSETMVPDSLPPGSFLCALCHLVHEVRQAWNRAHSRRWPCSRCGLVHAEYRLGAMIYGLDEFDCELLIPDLDNVVTHGNTVMLPAHVLKMLDKKRERELAAGKDHTKALVR